MHLPVDFSFFKISITFSRCSREHAWARERPYGHWPGGFRLLTPGRELWLKIAGDWADAMDWVHILPSFLPPPPGPWILIQGPDRSASDGLFLWRFLQTQD